MSPLLQLLTIWKSKYRNKSAKGLNEDNKLTDLRDPRVALLYQF